MEQLKENLFGPLETLKRDSLNHEEEAIRQLILFVSRHQKLPIETATDVVNKVLLDIGERKVAQFTIYERTDLADKAERTLSIRDFFKQVREERLVLTPSFSTYLPADQLESWVGSYVASNMELRTALRVEAYAAKAAGDASLARRKNVGQVLTKLDNNILSGTAISRGSILFNPSNHSSLTSMTRCITSTCNANSERFLAGRMNFFKVDIAIGYYAAILSNLEDPVIHANWVKIIAKYNLTIPTVENIMDSIIRNATLYFRWTNRADNLIRPFIAGMTDVELAASYYSGSLFNVRKLNDQLVRDFLEVTAFKADPKVPIPNVLELIDKLTPELRLLTHYRYYNELKGKGVDYDTFDPLLTTALYLTAVEYEKCFAQFTDFIKTVLMSKVHPPTIFDFKEAIRDSIIMSDTDSGVHFLEKWIEWYSGEVKVTVRNVLVADFLVTASSFNLQWLLRGIMRNMNVTESEIEKQRLHLKPEFCMIVFNLMSVSKHYAAGLYVENGNVMEEMELEMKGGTLRNSSIPEEIRNVNIAITRGIMLDVIETGKVSVTKYGMMGARMELKMFLSIHSGKAEYLRTIGIDAAESYKIKDPGKNRYHHCIFWNDVFSEELNYIAKPPYRAVKVPATLVGKKRILEWLENMDPTYKDKMTHWVNQFSKKDIKTIYIPLEYSTSYGLPAVIQEVIDSKRLVLDLCRMLYISLEALAFYCKPGLTILETLGHDLDYEYLKKLDESGELGGFDVGWTESDADERLANVSIPEEDATSSHR